MGFGGIQSFRVRFGYISGAVRLVLGLKRGSVAVVTFPESSGARASTKSEEC